MDVLAGPTVGFTAPEQDPPFGVGEDSGEGRFTGPYNLTGHPAISLPVPAAGPARSALQLAGRRGGGRRPAAGRRGGHATARAAAAGPDRDPEESELSHAHHRFPPHPA